MAPESPEAPKLPPKAMTAAEMAAKLETKTSIVQTSGGLSFKIRKMQIMDMGILGMFTLPVGKMSTEIEVLEAAKASVANPENRGSMLKNILLACCVEPSLSEGETDTSKNVLNYKLIPDGDKMELVGAILEFSGYADSYKEFFRSVPGAGGGDAGPSSQEIRDDAASAPAAGNG